MSQTEQTYEYKGKKYLRVGELWLDRDRLLVSDLLAARLTMEVDGKPASPPTPPAKAKAKPKTTKAKTTKKKAEEEAE